MIKNRILELEELAQRLEPDPLEREQMSQEVFAFTQQFLKELPEMPAFRQTPDAAAGLYSMPLAEEPKAISQMLAIVQTNLVEVGINGASGGHLGYIPVSAVFGAALGDYLAAVINRYSSLFYASPGAVRMANQLLRWMADLVDFPAEAGGNLTTSGSMAHLIGVVTGREAHQLKARDFDRTVVYLSQHTHYCVDKALRVAGLGECIRRFVPVDDHFRMQVSDLEAMINQDRQAGLLPWMLVATAGSTDTGSVDPLNQLATIAKNQKLWFQVDAAYGGFFLLCQQKKSIFAGIQHADAVVLDPHKGLFIPAGLGAVLIRDARLAMAAHSFEATYLQDVRSMPEEPSPAEMSPELTQHFRAMRLWFPLHYHGLAPFRAALEEKLLLAQYAWKRLLDAGFAMGPEPDLSVLAFRYLPGTGDANLFNQQLHQAVVADGRVFLTSTRLNGHFIIRMAILSFRTHLATIDLAIDQLVHHARRLEADFAFSPESCPESQANLANNNE